MELPAIFAIIPVGLLFLMSGLIINLIQAILYVLVRPLSKNMHRRFNKVVAELLWLETVWLFDWWAGVKVELHTDSETFHLMGKEHALLICNHRSDIDWLIGWVLAQRAGCLGCTMAIMKDVLKYLPVIGWSMWFSEYIFIKRRWDVDQSTLTSGCENLKDFPVPFWLALFVEGTRFTQSKLLDAQQHARSKGLDVPKHVLLPRTKGLVLAVKHMRSFIPAIYDITLAIAKDEVPPSMLTIFKGKSSVVKVHIKRHLMHDLPETSDDIAQWCKNMFVAKDAFLENYFSGGNFGNKEIQDIGLPKQSLIVMIVWSCLLSVGTFAFFLWTRLFSTWQGIIISAAFLLLVIVTMQVLILFSRSEPSIDSVPVKTPQKDSTRENLLIT
ncbi:1-acyl-sn-glycerol-3-phosphate acyltransferase PLS1-like isoform X1 [Beta vulgaris subsp. vulgaris]|uniref:1-acyl-sn-glycerol-3-phosphate acyltransferase PLS1-like isoform X1 n=1 Tax=Beta vulgaris subsp. vulgaris TaxID=3555 RepID=UPI00053FE1A9|nr:1-acyl-sn-glycerol-3-phosphate acyltransferase PLS1-like isoform X1 [Beta vulgaris subsp. vulgaris]